MLGYLIKTFVKNKIDQLLDEQSRERLVKLI